VRGLVERIASSADIDRAKQRQPKLPANWCPRNRAQDPSVVDLENLDRHLRIVFEIVAAYCLFRTLHELCWLALDPPFESMLTDAQPKEPAGEARTDDPDRDPWLNVLLRRLFESLEDETRQIVRITYVEGASVRDIEATAGLSKSTIQRKLEAFRRQLKELLEARGLMAADADLIGRALRDSFLS
jgi:DNA-directed RNA polymerase specialized sigma24 family protein